MTGTKILIIVLVLIVVLFVVLVGWGAHKHSPKNQQDSDASQHPAFLDGLNGLLGSRSPKIDAAHRVPSLSIFDLQKQASYTIDIGSDSRYTFRQAEMKLQPGACAHITFKPNGDPPTSLRLDQQDSNKSTKPNEFTLTVAKEGGRVYISRQSPINAAPCTITLE